MSHYTLHFQNNDKSRSLTVDMVSRSPEILYNVVGASIDSTAVPLHKLKELVDLSPDSHNIAKRLNFDGCLLHSPSSPSLASSPSSVSHTANREHSPTAGQESDCCSASVSAVPLSAIQHLRALVFSMPAADLLTLSAPPVLPLPPTAPGPLSTLRPLLVSIEGNVGAGKSSLLLLLRARHPEWVFIEEPVQFWETLRNKKGQSLFELYYEDQQRWSYTFQNCAVLSRYQSIETAISQHFQQQVKPTGQRQVFVTERCLSSDHEVFAKMLHDDGKIDTLEYTLYQKWLGQLLKSSTPLGAVVHVNTSADICATRVKERQRSGEEDIPLEYLQAVDSYQQAWVEGLETSLRECPVFRTGHAARDAVDEVEEFILSLQRPH